MNPTIFARITKVDEAKRLVYARVVEEVPDKADEIFDYATSKPYFEQWSKNQLDASGGKSHGNVRAMHGKIAAGIFAEPLSFSDTEKAIDGVIKVTDDQEWSKCLDGTYTGVSIGGSYVGERKAEKIGERELKRYTANPVEVSLVDSPCVPTARFFDIVKADGTVEQHEFKTAAAEPEKTGEPAPIEVRGTDAQVAELGAVLNASGLTLGDAIAALTIESMLDTVEAMEKREFSPEERKKAAKAGHAMPDGSFPINSKGDLSNAVQAYGRAKDKAKTKAHIIARAKALGATAALPESWTKGEKVSYPPAHDDGLIKTAVAKPLIESDTEEAFSSNVAAEIKAGTPKDQAVAIAYAVQRKARHKKAGSDGELKKGLWNVSRFAEILDSLADVCRGAESDLQAEGDASPLPMKLRNEVEGLIECFKEMADEESAEMLAQLKTHAGVGPDDEIEEALQAVARVGSLKKRLADPDLPLAEFVEIAKAHGVDVTTIKRGDITGIAEQIIAKAGTMSQAHKDKIQAVHDHAADMGAECRAPEKAAQEAELKKTADQAAQLAEALERIKKLEAQPMPHVMLRTTALRKEQANGTEDGKGAGAWLLSIPYEKLVKLPGGLVDWDASERALQHLKPADAV